MDILLFGTPKSWQKEMDRQGYDPLENNVESVVEFMERLEATDKFDGSAVTQNHSKQNNSKKNHGSAKKPPPSAHGGKKKFCLLHGEGRHDTDECFALQNEAKKLKTSREGGSSQGGAKNGSTNKTWNRKAAEGKAKTKNDLAAFIGKEIAKGIKKQQKDLAAIGKKRKSAKRDSSDSECDLNAFDLQDFNYEDMENLTIDDDGVDC